MAEATMATLPPRTSSVGSSAGGATIGSGVGVAATMVKDPELLLDQIDSTGGRYASRVVQGESGWVIFRC